MKSSKPMLNAEPKGKDAGEQFLQRVLNRLKQAREWRQLAKKTAHVKGLASSWK
jgi:hypothetical protein